MLKLLLGLFLFSGLHLQKRLAPAFRRDLIAATNEAVVRSVVALCLVLSVVLIVVGYREWDTGLIYSPIAGVGYINNVLMIAAIFLFGVGFSGGPLSARIRHPMLWGLLLWAVSHLLVNGDGASVVMFGFLAIWSLVEIRLINIHEGPWQRPMPGNAVQDAKLFLTALFLYAVIAGVHWLFGLNVFAGNF